MSDPIEDIIGNYRAFAAQQRDRLTTRGIDITSYGLSHLAYRVPEWDDYVRARALLEDGFTRGESCVKTGEASTVKGRRDDSRSSLS